MTEKEKLLEGLLYDANYDQALMEERNACKDIYNQIKPSCVKEQQGAYAKAARKDKTTFYNYGTILV